jgi:NAD-dependent SIR2 family protein deacetylase
MGLGRDNRIYTHNVDKAEEEATADMEEIK